MDNSGSHTNNIAGGSNAPQHWLSLNIKKEEESISQSGDLLDFTNQDSIKSEESESPSATTQKQVSVHDIMIKAASQRD